MDPRLIEELSVRSKEEIVDFLRQLIKRHRRRFIERYMRPCPENCKLATTHRGRVTGCDTCASRNPEQCRRPDKFVALNDRDELYHEFGDDLRNKEVLQHDYRDILALMWVLNIEVGEEQANQTVDTIAVSEKEAKR